MMWLVERPPNSERWAAPSLNAAAVITHYKPTARLPLLSWLCSAEDCPSSKLRPHS